MDTKLSEAWPTLKRLIKESATDFYPSIADLSAADLANQPEKVRFTVWKYFNRSRYRSTPFGEFAALSVIPVHENAHPIVLSQQMDTLHWPDWQHVIQPNYDNQALYHANFRTNPLCYRYGEEYHYLCRSKKQFDLNAIPSREDIDLLLEFCRTLRSFDEIAALMLKELGMKKISLLALIRQLLELEVLQCDLQANITGEDYFQRRSLHTIKGQRYTMASRIVLGGSLNETVTNELKGFVEFMARCVPTPVNTQLEQFKSPFLQLWEQRNVPLSLAMDPILGIGYGQDAEVAQASLVGELQQGQRSKGTPQISYGKFEQFLLNGMISGKTIHLEAFTPEASPIPLPNTSSILFHCYDGHPVIHHAGGATAMALLARFTPFEEIGDLALELSEIEQSANPSVTFFDLAYQFEGRTDNVNRRRQLYATELAIGSWSTMAEPLRLEDILVSVREGQLMLHHRESGKRLVPRLASAYNHGRSDLDLFRFLCDLQYQGIQSNLSIDLQVMFPHLEHYPRVYFKNVIACPAKWKLPQFQQAEGLLGWLAEHRLMDPFTVGQADQTLVIDPKVAGDLQLLLQYQKQQTASIYLTEALIDKDAKVINEGGNSFHTQFIASVIHRDEVYRSHPPTEHAFLRDLRMPGGEWCYVELYMRPEVMDSFLMHEVRSLVSRQKDLIKEWFFIRYNQPEPHLRLRMKLYDPTQLSMLLQQLQSLMDISKQYGQLRRLEVKGYEREIMRYGEKQMNMVEHFFYVDSVWALRQFRLSEEERYGEVICFAEQLCAVLFESSSSQTAFFLQLSERFASEMRFGQREFKKINKASLSQLAAEQTDKKLVSYFSKLIKHYAPEQQFRLLADLIHMHVNRRFCGAQRMHEAVIYQFLYKRSLKKQYQHKKAPSLS